MIIDANFEGLKQIKNGDYVFEGNLESKENIEIHLNDRFVIRGSITTEKSIIAECGIEAGEGIKAGCGIEAGEGIKAGWGIEAGEGIKAGWGIEAGEGIKAGCGIEAGEGIKAGWGIEAGFRIFAGTSVYRSSKNCIKTISCKRLIKGEIAFGQLIERGEKDG